MRTGYFPLPVAGPHLKPPSLPHSRSKSIIICLWIFLVLFLAWGISMTAVYTHHTRTHNITSIGCNTNTGQCFKSMGGFNIPPVGGIVDDGGSRAHLRKFDSMQECSESCRHIQSSRN